MTDERGIARPNEAMARRRLDVAWTAGADGVHFTARGEIDSASATAFLAELQDAIADTDGPIVVDLGTVTFIDCSGLTALVTARDSADGRLRLGTLHPTVRRLLEITTLIDHFPQTKETLRDGDLDR